MRMKFPALNIVFSSLNFGPFLRLRNFPCGGIKLRYPSKCVLLAAPMAAGARDRLCQQSYVNEELKSSCSMSITGIGELRLVHSGPSNMHRCCTFLLASAGFFFVFRAYIVSRLTCKTCTKL